MQTYTQDFNDAIRAADREMRGYLEFNGDSTKQMHGADGLIQFTVHREMQNAERFCVGSVASSYCEASFFNSGIPAGVSLANSYFDAYVGVVLPDTTVEYKPLGRFFITEISRETETTAVVAYDEIAYKMDVPYTPTITAGVNGYKALDILNDIIDQTGCNGGTHYSGWNWYVPQLFEASCKDTFAWIVAAGRSFATDMMTAYDYSSTPTVGTKRFNKATYTSYPAITDDVIYMDGLKLGDTFTISSYTTGTEDNPIVCGSGVGPNNPNPYINSTQADAIFSDINGETYTPMTLHFRGDPCIMVNDCLKVTTGGVDYKCVPMRIVSTFNGGFEQTIDCWGDSEAYYEMSYSPMEAKIQTNNTLIKDIAQAIETARNGVITQILDTDGSWKELCISNNQDLSQATSVWRFNINGLAHSTAYQGGTYTFALDDQGRIVASVIQTGILQDALGHNSWNLDTGAFTITDGSLDITTAADSNDRIVLRGPTETLSLAPFSVDVNSAYTANNRAIMVQSGAIYGFKAAPNQNVTKTQSLYISSTGVEYLGGYSATGGGYAGYLYLHGGTSADVNRILLNGATGTAAFYDAAGTQFASISGSGTLSLGASGASGYIYLNDTGGTKNAIIESNGQFFYNGTNKYTYLMWPDSSGAGRLVLGDGTSTKWRTSLENTGLTFRDASDNVTAFYPSGGLTATYPSAITSNVPNVTSTAVRSIQVTAGKYFLVANVAWNDSSSSTGVRQCCIGVTSNNVNAGDAWDFRNATSAGSTRHSLSCYVEPSATTTYYLVCYQNSGSTMSLAAYGLWCIKLP